MDDGLERVPYVTYMVRPLRIYHKDNRCMGLLCCIPGLALFMRIVDDVQTDYALFNRRGALSVCSSFIAACRGPGGQKIPRG